MALWQEILVNLLGYGITACVAGMVIVPIYFFTGGGALLPLQRKDKGRWSGAEVWLTFVLLLFMPAMVRRFLDDQGFYQALFVKQPSPDLEDIWASVLYTPLILAVLFWFMFRISRTRPARLGLTLSRWRQDAMLGYLVFLLITPLVLGMYVLVALFFREVFQTPTQHHPLEKLATEPLTALDWLVIFFRATLAAPVLEETAFRGVLQGWLRRASPIGHLMVILITLGCGATPYLTKAAEKQEQANEFVVTMAASVVASAGSSPGQGSILAAALHAASSGLVPEVTEAPDGNLGGLIFAGILALCYALIAFRESSNNSGLKAIFGSAMVFAVFHSTVWPSPIPLFLFGFVLGYLAYRTHSLVPGIVVHCLFNTVACLELISVG